MQSTINVFGSLVWESQIDPNSIGLEIYGNEWKNLKESSTGNDGHLNELYDNNILRVSLGMIGNNVEGNIILIHLLKFSLNIELKQKKLNGDEKFEKTLKEVLKYKKLETIDE